MVVLTGIYEYKTLFWIKKRQYKHEYENQVSLRIQETFISYFTCLLNLLFTLPLRNFHRKNELEKYVKFVLCLHSSLLDRYLYVFCVYMVGFRFTCAMLIRIFMSVMWHGIFITLWLIYHESNESILFLHYVFGAFLIIDLGCILLNSFIFLPMCT